MPNLNFPDRLQLSEGICNNTQLEAILHVSNAEATQNTEITAGTYMPCQLRSELSIEVSILFASERVP